MQTLCRILVTTLKEDTFSFFRYTRDIAGPKPPEPLRKVCSLMRTMGCAFVVEEEVEVTPEAKEEVRLLERFRNKGPIARTVKRLSFFRLSCQSNALDSTSLEKELTADFSTLSTVQYDLSKQTERFNKFVSLPNKYDLKLLGILTLHVDYQGKELLGAYVQEAFIRNSPSLCEFIHSEAKQKFFVLGKEFSITGSYFAQQQGRLTCCAHAALMVVAKNIYAALNKECPLSYSKINGILKIDSEEFSTECVCKGLSPEEMQKALRDGAGIQSVIMRASPDGTTLTTPAELINAVYHCVEVGLPTIICFSGDNQSHAMAVVGHNFAPNLWQGCVTNAYFSCTQSQPYLPSHSWVEGLLVQDDNFGPYCLLPKKILDKLKLVAILPQFPQNILYGRPEYAEIAIVRGLKNSFCKNSVYTLIQDISTSHVSSNVKELFWFKTLCENFDKNRLILRTTLCTKDRYINHLNELFMFNSKQPAFKTLQNHLFENPFWFVEISVPELFTHNRHKLGEAIVYRTSEKICVVSAIRLPGVLTLVNSLGELEHFYLENATYHYPLIERCEEVFEDTFELQCTA